MGRTLSEELLRGKRQSEERAGEKEEGGGDIFRVRRQPQA